MKSIYIHRSVSNLGYVFGREEIKHKFRKGRRKSPLEPLAAEGIHHLGVCKRRIISHHALHKKRGERSDPAHALHHSRLPAQLLHRLDNSAHEKNHALVVLLRIRVDLQRSRAACRRCEIIVRINEIDLHTRRLKRRNLYYKRMISIIDNDIHSRKPDDLMKLIATLVDTPVFRHKRANLKPALLHLYRHRLAYKRKRRISEIGRNLLRNIQNLIVAHCHKR